MTGLRPHTRDYSQDARERLGVAFIRARETAGYPSRPAFARASGVGKTSLYKLETGIPVSAAVYEAAARAIPGWSEDTPRLILEGDPPPLSVTPPELPEPESADHTPDPLDDWTEEDERRYQLLKEMLRSQGLEMTPRILRIMKDEYDRLRAQEAANTSTAKATHGDQ